jgi:dTDP-4-amino-4,6-dideoxygalactose transaminase
MFDAAHAFGCSHNGKMIGNFGNCEVFSFHATKFVNSLEGGAVLTNDSHLAEKIRLMHNCGFLGFDNVVCEGTNGKMNEISAAMGLTSLESMADFISVNRAHYDQYQMELADIPGLRIMEYDNTERCNYQYVVIEIDEMMAGLDRDSLVAVLHAENIIARRYFYPCCHRMQPYRSIYPNAGKLLPNTERLSARVVSVPTGTGVTSKDISQICGVIRYAVRHADAVTMLLRSRERAVGP